MSPEDIIAEAMEKECRKICLSYVTNPHKKGPTRYIRNGQQGHRQVGSDLKRGRRARTGPGPKGFLVFFFIFLF
jgi:hypothetical protein